MAKRGKKYRAMVAQIGKNTLHSPEAAVEAIKRTRYAGFDETIEVAVNLGVKPRHADQMVRGAVVLPHGLGKSIRVIAFAKGDKEREAREAGADFVGGDDLIKQIQDGWLDFDSAVATPDMMALVGRIARILGPRGLMPNPKVGTVTFNIGAAVQELKAGRAEFRVDKAGIIHAPLGKISFDTNKIVENMQALMDTLIRLKPATSKGTYVKKITLSSTMGPGVPVDSGAVVS
ncbi:MAG: 50S ribosomal protein L1 [Myxococcota bacterium]|nr:50S ribosomal protein L1 [Myxococcota bacterium]